MDRSSSGMRHGIVAVGPVVLALALCAGCSIVQGEKDIRVQQQRIDDKSQQYEREVRRNDALNDDKRRFSEDLANRQMTLNELNNRLNRLQSDNAQRASVNREQQQKKTNLDRQINQMRVDLQSLQRRNDLSDSEKASRIEALKLQIRQQLELSLD